MRDIRKHWEQPIRSLTIPKSFQIRFVCAVSFVMSSRCKFSYVAAFCVRHVAVRIRTRVAAGDLVDQEAKSDGNFLQCVSVVMREGKV